MTGPGSVRPSAPLNPSAPLAPSLAVALAEGLRYGVPRSLIEAATRRRLAGDWRAACSVADVDVAFDPADVSRRHGRSVASALLDDLQRFAPDLLRWHLPRCGHGRGLLREGCVVPLAGYGDPGRTLTLAALTPRAALDAGQRVVLALVPDGASFGDGRAGAPVWPGLRRATAGRYDLRLHRERWQAGDVGHRTAPSDAGDLAAAWAAASGASRDGDPPGGDPRPAGRAGQQGQRALRRAARVLVDPVGLLPEIRRVLPGEPVVALRPGGGLAVLVEGLLAGVPGVRFVPASAARGLPVVPDAAWRPRPEADLVRLGLLHPDEVHPLVVPLVGPLVAPSVPGDGPGPVAARAVLDRRPDPVAVRCLDRDHHVELVGGRWTAVDHEQDGPAAVREQLLVRLGAPASPCRQVVAELRADAVLADHVEGLLAHGRIDDALDLVRRGLGERTEPADVVLTGGESAAVHLARLHDARLALRLLLSGVPEPSRCAPPSPPRRTDPAGASRPTRRRSRKGDPARTHR